MKKIILSLFMILPMNSFAQRDGYYKIASEFYSQVDSSHKWTCCDSLSNTYDLIYKIPLYELPVFDKLDLKDYEEQFCDDLMVDNIVHDLVIYFNKLSKSKRNKIQRSCYTIKENYKIEYDKTGSNIYWVDGYITIKFKFQSDDKCFALPWHKRIFHKLRL